MDRLITAVHAIIVLAIGLLTADPAYRAQHQPLPARAASTQKNSGSETVAGAIRLKE